MAMNTHLKTVKLIPKGKNPITLDALSVRGNNIRYPFPAPLDSNTYKTPNTCNSFVLGTTFCQTA